MLNSILRSKSIYLARTDQDGNYTFINDHFCNSLGINRNLVIGVQFVTHIIPEDRLKCIDAFKKCIGSPEESSRALLRKPHAEADYITSEWEFIASMQGDQLEILCIGYDVTDRELIEKDLFSANQRLATYINNSPLGIVEYDKSLTIMQWSKRSEAIFGWTEGEILNKKFSAFDIIYEEDMAATAKVGEELLSGAVDGNVSFNRNRTKSGDVVHCIWYNSVIKDEHGNVDSIMSLVQDITERSEAEEKVIASESRFRALIEHGNDAISILSEKGQPIYATSSIKRVLGYNEEETLKLDVFALMHPDDIHNVAGSMQRAIENPGVPVKGDISRMKHKDGTWRWIEATITNLIDDPNIGGIVNNFRDITESVEAEQIIKKTNRHLERAQYIARLGYWELSLSGNGGYWSDEMYTITGIGDRGIPPALDEFIDLIDKQDKERVMASHQMAIENDKTQTADFKLNRKDGSTIYVQTFINRIKDHSGNAIALEGTLQDITERKRAEGAVLRLLDTTTDQNKRLKDFSFMTSHNIRSSVANLLGLSTLLASDPGNPSIVTMITSTTQQLDATLKNISELLNFENEFSESHRESCNLSESIHRILTLNAGVITQKNIEVKVDVAPDLKVNVIPAYLDSILHNLISNAIKYGITSTSKRIDVEAIRTNQTITVSVKDYGLGIDLKKNSKKLFKLGSRLHTSSDGQGLGLFMTKHQIETMGGQIEVQSEENEGATFIVTLND